MAEFNTDKPSERLEQFSPERLATTKKLGRTYRRPGREAVTRNTNRVPTDQTGDTEAVLDERTVLRHLESNLDHDGDHRAIRGIVNGLAYRHDTVDFADRRLSRRYVKRPLLSGASAVGTLQ